MTASREGRPNAGAAVGAVMRAKERRDLLRQRPVLLRVPTRAPAVPGVEARPRHAEQPTEARHTQPRPLAVDERERRVGGAEQNRMAFFRRACSSCNIAWSRSSVARRRSSRAGGGAGAGRFAPRSVPSRHSRRHFDSIKG